MKKRIASGSGFDSNKQFQHYRYFSLAIIRGWIQTYHVIYSDLHSRALVRKKQRIALNLLRYPYGEVILLAMAQTQTNSDYIWTST